MIKKQFILHALLDIHIGGEYTCKRLVSNNYLGKRLVLNGPGVLTCIYMGIRNWLWPCSWAPWPRVFNSTWKNNAVMLH